MIARAAHRLGQGGRELLMVEGRRTRPALGVDEDELPVAAGQVIPVPEAAIGVEPMGRDPHLEDEAVGGIRAGPALLWRRSVPGIARRRVELLHHRSRIQRPRVRPGGFEGSSPQVRPVGPLPQKASSAKTTSSRAHGVSTWSWINPRRLNIPVVGGWLRSDYRCRSRVEFQAGATVPGGNHSPETKPGDPRPASL